MNVDKAIKKQKSNYIVFVFFMSFIFAFLPTMLYLSGKRQKIFFVYLIIIDILILIELYRKAKNDLMEIKYDGDTLKMKNGFLNFTYSINCSKVLYVHSIGEGNKLNIILVTKNKIKSKSIKEVKYKDIKYYAEIREYEKLNEIENKREHYYVISKGGYIKYDLLNSLYKYCVDAKFSNIAIERIKEFREEN